jgi:Cation efflux family
MITRTTIRMVPTTPGMIMRSAIATRMASSIPRLRAAAEDYGRSNGSFAGLAATAIVQLAVVLLSGSVALLADTIHNFGDAATAIPLVIAFWFSRSWSPLSRAPVRYIVASRGASARKKPSERFTFGYGRVEDLAGVAIVLTKMWMPKHGTYCAGPAVRLPSRGLRVAESGP